SFRYRTQTLPVNAEDIQVEPSLDQDHPFENPSFVIKPSPTKDAIEKASALLRDGQVVAFPTETVYGLGADCTNDAAVKRIFAAKSRPSDNPLIIHVSSISQLERLMGTDENGNAGK